MSTKQLVYSIGADFAALDRATDVEITKTRAWRTEMRQLQQQQREHRAAITDLGQAMAGFGVAVAAGMGLAVKAAIDWESEFAGVRKTVDETTVTYADLEQGLRGLARTLPATHKEIAAVAEAAGQLGIKADDIVGFTKVMIDLGETTNLTADEAATALAKFANIMGTSSNQVDRLGSALVALGNDGASTEKDILDMGLRIASAGRQVGLTESQVLAFASSLSSVGMEAEAGGSAFSTAIVKMSMAARQGGDELEIFAQVAGVSADAFATKFRHDAAGAMVDFIAGLHRMQLAGGNTFAVMEALGLSDLRVRQAMLSAAGASDLFAHSLEVGSDAWIENTALTEEANKRYETTASRMKVAGNQVKDAMIDIGAAILPMVAGAVQGFSDMVRAFSELPEPAKAVVAIVGLAAAGIALVGGAALMAYPKLLAFRAEMTTLAATGGAAAGALGKFGLFMTGPWGAAIGIGVTLLGLFGATTGGASRRQQELAEAGRSVADAIKEQNGVIDDSVRAAAAKAAAEKGLLDDARDLGIELPRVTDAILGQGDAYDTLVSHLDDVIRLNTTTLETGDVMNAEAEAAFNLKSKLTDLVGGKDEQLKKEQDTAAATRASTGASLDQVAALEKQASRAKEVKEALDEMIKSLNDLNGITLSVREAQRGYLEQMAETAETLGRNGKTLDANTKAGRENAEALDAQAKAAGELAEATAREAEKTGGSTAGIAAFKASLESSRPALIAQALAMGMLPDEAVKYTDSVLSAATATIQFAGLTQVELTKVKDAVNGIPPNKAINVGALTAEAQQKLKDLGFTVVQLPDGTVVVTANTAGAYAALADLTRPRTVRITPIFTSSGAGYITAAGTRLIAQGGVLSFAGGGTWENHQPQVAKTAPGTVRIWAEPETGNESYIPWAMDRRDRATGILGYTANAFGYDLVPSAPARSVGGSSYSNSRSVDASTTIHTVYTLDLDDLGRTLNAHRSRALFQAGLTG